jgi:exonuclease III
MPRPPGGLNIASHNVGGMSDSLYSELLSVRIHALTRIWLYHRIDIVCLQERHIVYADIAQAKFQLARASEILGGCGWDNFWTPASSTTSTGVAILIKHSLVSSGILQVGRPVTHDTGRLLTLPNKWGAHSFTLASTQSRGLQG